jgi:pSer/pThr/pTyr-binding forkhead associated (FHA) protein
LEVEPPAIRVHDLGSRNGTYVNGGNIGQRPRHLSPEEVNSRALPGWLETACVVRPRQRHEQSPFEGEVGIARL